MRKTIRQLEVDIPPGPYGHPLGNGEVFEMVPENSAPNTKGIGG